MIELIKFIAALKFTALQKRVTVIVAAAMTELKNKKIKTINTCKHYSVLWW